jgi:hypothetical protein
MKRRLRQSVGIVIALIGGATCLGACSHQHQYSAAPISAQVLDAETGRPVAGVYVVADWQLLGGLEGGSNIGAVTVMETQTDETGRFRFPAWGPKEIVNPSGVYSNARVRNRAPGLTLFKSGYEYAVMVNYRSVVPDPNNMHSEWDRKTIQLKPFHGTTAQYKNLLWLS